MNATIKNYPNDLLDEVVETLLDAGLTKTQLKNLVADIVSHYENVEQDRNEAAWEAMQERGSDDSSYRRDMINAGRGHLLK